MGYKSYSKAAGKDGKYRCIVLWIPGTALCSCARCGEWINCHWTLPLKKSSLLTSGRWGAAGQLALFRRKRGSEFKRDLLRIPRFKAAGKDWKRQLYDGTLRQAQGPTQWLITRVNVDLSAYCCARWGKRIDGSNETCCIEREGNAGYVLEEHGKAWAFSIMKFPYAAGKTAVWRAGKKCLNGAACGARGRDGNKLFFFCPEYCCARCRSA